MRAVYITPDSKRSVSFPGYPADRKHRFVQIEHESPPWLHHRSLDTQYSQTALMERTRLLDFNPCLVCIMEVKHKK